MSAKKMRRHRNSVAPLTRKQPMLLCLFRNRFLCGCFLRDGFLSGRFRAGFLRAGLFHTGFLRGRLLGGCFLCSSFLDCWHGTTSLFAHRALDRSQNVSPSLDGSRLYDDFFTCGQHAECKSCIPLYDERALLATKKFIAMNFFFRDDDARVFHHPLFCVIIMLFS